MMRLSLVTPPAGEPISLVDAKRFLRVDEDLTHDDGLITRLIKSARQSVEEITGRALLPQTWSLTGFPGGQLVKLPWSPVTAITSVTDARGVLTAGDYAAVLGDFARLAAHWQGEATIVYQAGYASADAVPEPILTWMQMRVTTLYQNRSQIQTGISVAELPRALLDGLLEPYLAIW